MALKQGHVSGNLQCMSELIHLFFPSSGALSSNCCVSRCIEHVNKSVDDWAKLPFSSKNQRAHFEKVECWQLNSNSTGGLMLFLQARRQGYATTSCSQEHTTVHCGWKLLNHTLDPIKWRIIHLDPNYFTGMNKKGRSLFCSFSFFPSFLRMNKVLVNYEI